MNPIKEAQELQLRLEAAEAEGQAEVAVSDPNPPPSCHSHLPLETSAWSARAPLTPGLLLLTLGQRATRLPLLAVHLPLLPVD